MKHKKTSLLAFAAIMLAGAAAASLSGCDTSSVSTPSSTTSSPSTPSSTTSSSEPEKETIIISGENHVYVGETLQLSASVAGASWSVSEGASIDTNGLLTAGEVAKNVVVTASKDGYNDGTYSVAIEEIPVVDVASIKIVTTLTDGRINENTSTTLSAIVLPENATDKSVVWSINNEVEYASITQDGVLSVSEVASDSEVVVKAVAGNKEDTLTLTVADVAKVASLVVNADDGVDVDYAESSYVEGDVVVVKLMPKEGKMLSSVTFNGEKANGTASYGVYEFTLAAGVNVVNVASSSLLAGVTLGNPTNDFPTVSVNGSTTSIINSSFKGNFFVQDVPGTVSSATHYTMSCHIEVEGDAPYLDGEQQIGMVPYYYDEDNWLVAYAQFVDWDKNGWAREFMITGMIGGQIISPEYQDMFLEGATINPGAGVDFIIIREGAKFILEIVDSNNQSYKREITRLGFEASEETAKVGIYAMGRKTSFSNMSITDNAAPASEWSILPFGNPTISEESGVVTYDVGTDGNWLCGLGVKDVTLLDKANYTISADISSTVTSPIATTEMYIGFTLYYVDASNYLVGWVQWHSETLGNVRCFDVTGFINGADVSWHSMWVATGKAVDSTDFHLEVTRLGNQFTFVCDEFTESTAVTQLDVNANTSKLGVYADRAGVVTYSNLTISN